MLDGEPVYEGHPVGFKAKEFGHSVAADIRRPLYWDLFSGACGHTYGHHSVWQFYAPGRKLVNDPLMPWTVAIDDPGAGQMRQGRRLIESRPYAASRTTTVLVRTRWQRRSRGRHPAVRGHPRFQRLVRDGVRPGRPAVLHKAR